MTATHARIDWTGSPAAIVALADAHAPGAAAVIEQTRDMIPWLKRQIWEEQAAVLYALARAYNRPDARILEIGTAWGYSAAVLAQAAPQAAILTLNPKSHEVEAARRHLAAFRRVMVLEMTSARCWELFSATERFDLVFVDGDHRPGPLREDMRWFNRLTPGGLIFFHDFSPAESARPCPAVYDTLHEFRDELGRDFDVRVMDDRQVGMAGWRRRDGETWPPGEDSHGQ